VVRAPDDAVAALSFALSGSGDVRAMTAEIAR
jgi:hypothetical protein